MKIGLFKLNKSKISGNDWYFIIDTSIQMGPQKFVVVLGVKKADINQSFCPTLEEAETLVVRPLTTCPGEIINEILEEAVLAVGKNPIAIVSDQGSELKRGGRLFQNPNSETIHLFDISHKINGCEKELLKNDEIWSSFKTAMTNAIQQLKLSSIAHLAPSKQRTKDRMHSSLHLIEYGFRLLAYLDSDRSSQLTEEEKKKLAWIYDYKDAIPKFVYLKTLSESALKLVHDNGYYQGLTQDFLKQADNLPEENIRYPDIREKIRAALQEEEDKIPDGVHHLGSSEIIESLFGKFKGIEGVHASSGLSSSVLLIPALVGKMDEDILAEALQEISINDVENWVEDKMGQTFLSRRRQALSKVMEDAEIVEAKAV